MSKRQRDIFLDEEGDNWLKRNLDALETRDFRCDDDVVRSLDSYVNRSTGSKVRYLEIGCGSGHRLKWLSDNFNYMVSGIEPSSKSVQFAESLGLSVVRGTAESLPWPKNSFDVVCFGFCLYLCDRSDLFRIAAEADRVLSEDGWLLVHDFFSPAHRRRDYSHRPGVYSWKMDYSSLFRWHPAYVMVHQAVTAHGTAHFSDDPDSWVAISVLRKHSSGI